MYKGLGDILVLSMLSEIRSDTYLPLVCSNSASISSIALNSTGYISFISWALLWTFWISYTVVISACILDCIYAILISIKFWPLPSFFLSVPDVGDIALIFFSSNDYFGFNSLLLWVSCLSSFCGNEVACPWSISYSYFLCSPWPCYIYTLDAMWLTLSIIDLILLVIFKVCCLAC